MYGYWHLPAVGVLTCFIALQTDLVYILIIYLGWLFYLFFTERLTKLPLILTLLISLLAFFYLPTPIHKTESFPEETIIKLNGKVHSAIKEGENHFTFQLKETNSNDLYLIIYFQTEEENDLKTTVKYGAKCTISGEVGHVQIATNPGQFDYGDYLQKSGIKDQVRVLNPEDIQCFGSHALSRIYTFKNNLVEKMNENLSPLTVSWSQALVLGDDSNIDGEVVDLFQRWGLSHILAISGLHVGIIVGLVYFICLRLNLLTIEQAQVTILLFLPLYAVLAGGEPSVWRASLMIAILIVMRLFRSKMSLNDLISLVFLHLILLNPYVFFHIGFQFSFLVTLAILLSRKWLSLTNSSVFQLLQISFISQMVIIPLQIIYFHTFTPLSIIVNVLVVPYFSLLIIPLTFCFVLILNFPFMQLPLYLLDSIFVILHEKVLSLLKQMDENLYHPFVIGDFPGIVIFIYYGMLIFLMLALENARIKQSLIFGLLICFVIISLELKPYFSSEGKLTMLDIGQGDAIVIELPYRRGVILIDAGARFTFEEHEPTETVYKNIIKPFLLSRGIKSIDAVFLSHDHIDHNGSLPFIVDDYRVKNIFISPYYEWEDWEKEALQNQNIAVHRLNKGANLAVAGQAFFILGPGEDFKDKNNNSLVLLTEFGGKKWLFTGDMEKEAERAFIDSYKDLQVDVLKIAHHGSQTSTQDYFLENLSIKSALISVGRNNMYGHPSADVINELNKEGVEIYRTDQQGAIQYEFKDFEAKFIPFLQE